MDKGIVVFVEGETDLSFYTKILNELKILSDKFNLVTPKVLKKDMGGIGKFKNKAKRIFVNNIIQMYPDIEFTVFLCYDTDVFEYAIKPPVIWKEVDNSLLLGGADKVIHIKQKKSIEDWFLIDQESLCKYLKLQSSTKCTGKTGADKINCLFKKANKVYIKGRTNDFIEELDIKRIISKVHKELNPLCKEFGIKYVNGKFIKD